MPKWSGIGTFFRFSDVITAIRIKTGRISVKYGTFIIKSRASKARLFNLHYQSNRPGLPSR